MTIDPALLRAVLIDPADDLARLILADWLDDHDQPERAEFVRCQVELTRPSQCLTCSGRRWYEVTDTHSEDCLYCAAALRRRERELFANNLHHWMPRVGADALLSEAAYRCVGGPDADIRHHTVALYSRGFISEVRAPLASLFGGECGRCRRDGWPGTLIGDPDCSRCDGYGRVSDPDSRHSDGTMDCPDCDRVACPACSGTGTTPGVAADLFARHPVTRVTVTDREPWTNGHELFWFDVEHELAVAYHPQSNLPRPLYLMLSDGRPVGSDHCRVYPTAAAAHDALSTACVAWGRALAGLPPIWCPPLAPPAAVA